MPISSVFISERWVLYNYLDIKLLPARARRSQIQNEFGLRRLTAHPAYPILSPSFIFLCTTTGNLHKKWQPDMWSSRSARRKTEPGAPWELATMSLLREAI